jgi:hypothetical protein
MCEDFWRILQTLLNTFGVFSDFDKTLLAYSRNTQKNYEYADTNLHFKRSELEKNRMAQEEQLTTFFL